MKIRSQREAQEILIEDARRAAQNAALNIYKRLSIPKKKYISDHNHASTSVKSNSVLAGKFGSPPPLGHEYGYESESISVCEPSVVSALSLDTTISNRIYSNNHLQQKDHGRAPVSRKIRNTLKSISSGNIVKTRKSFRDIWMCCYCGNSFISEETATDHEFICIQNAFGRGFNSSGSMVSKNTNRRMQLHPSMTGHIEIPFDIKAMMVITDEALLKTVKTSKLFILTKTETENLKSLALTYRDRIYFDIVSDLTYVKKSLSKKDLPAAVARKGIVSKLHTRLAEAYELIKEGNATGHANADHYERKHYRGDTTHDEDTMYVNIIVKQSIKFVTNELERIATERWTLDDESEHEHFRNQFERIRRMAHTRALQLAKLALQADAKPEKVAIQLSNDLFRLFPLQLKQVGVEVEADIEFRKGSFFILSVNIKSIDWQVLMETCHRVLLKRKAVRKTENSSEHSNRHQSYTCRLANVSRKSSAKEKLQCSFQSLFNFELLEYLLSFLYNFHWFFSLPFCYLLYYFQKNMVDMFILIATTDDVYQYIERKGMEMDLVVKHATQQSSFFYDALQIIRRDEFDKTKKQDEAHKGKDERTIRGSLLGPKMALDNFDVGPIPETLVPPENLETISMDIDLPVGYHRLRYALLNNPAFVEAWFVDFLKYGSFSYTPWEKYDGQIGLEKLDDTVNESEFVGSKLKYSYLMPQSAFVAANTAYEEVELTSYNQYFFSTFRNIRNPDVPYGNSFISQVQTVVYNTAAQRCHMVISCETFFPNREPIVSRTIKSAMRAGTSDSSVLLGEAICRYAEIYV